MQLRHVVTLTSASADASSRGFIGNNKVTAIAFSPNNRKLAVCGFDRVVRMYNERGEVQDKFSTKPADRGRKTYSVRSIGFSPDSTKLAVAQSDNIVFVYKIGLDWGEKKSICNKFLQPSSVTSLTWPSNRATELIYGLAEGKVKVGQLRSNKSATLYSTDSFVCALTSCVDGRGICSAHLDTSIYRLLFDQAGAVVHSKFACHKCIPYSLAWGHSLVCSGDDGSIVFYGDDGSIQNVFNASRSVQTIASQSCAELTISAASPGGETIVVGTWNSFIVYSYARSRGVWIDEGARRIDKLYSVTALSWKHDGTCLAVGSLFGAVDLYDACVRRYVYKGKFEFTYSSLSQVIVKRLGTGTRIVLKSIHGCEIVRINIFRDRFISANTRDHRTVTETLLLGDLASYKVSEVPWSNGGNEKFVFDNPACCMVHRAGELALVEYGCNEMLGSVRTDYISGHLLSLQIKEKQSHPNESLFQHAENNTRPVKTIGYLLDAQSINVRDLVTGTCTTFSHDASVDWLELNGCARLLLFRDKRRQLHLVDLRSHVRVIMLDFCTYVQWVPDSDVVVAQNRHKLCVWYNIQTPDQVTVHQIRGNIENIERVDGRTEVIVSETLSTASYLLDEALIQFGTALDACAYTSAVDILECLESSAEAEAMWKRLEEVSLAESNLATTQRCTAALGNVARTRYLRRLLSASNMQCISGPGNVRVCARCALLAGEDKRAEALALSQGHILDAIKMQQELHNFEQAVAIAVERRLPQAQAMRDDHFQYLLDSNQASKAAKLKECEGELTVAIQLYLSAGMPGRARQLLKQHDGRHSTALLERVAVELSTNGLYEHAGELYERMDQLQRAMDYYIKGTAFCKAVELARKTFPSKVVELQEMWGNHLIENNQVEMAINHFIEASASSKAIQAALGSKQWKKAEQLLDMLDSDAAAQYHAELALHYDEIGDAAAAERQYKLAKTPTKAVEMYVRQNRWNHAHRVAVSYMEAPEVHLLCISHAQKLESDGKLSEAEQIYLTVDEPDLAINMYKKERNFDAMIRLVGKYRCELLKETHQYLAQHLESEGHFHDAEHHYCEAGEWLSAVNMYRTSDLWQDAMRVAKLHGGVHASKRVAYAWAIALGGEAGARLLTKQGLIEPAIDYAMESGAFDHALDLAKTACPSKTPEVHLKHALLLEDEERFKEAEIAFIQAHKPREAIDMYIHQQAWSDALEVAKKHESSAAGDIYAAHARSEAAAGNHHHAEELFLLAGKPELALSMYRDASLWKQARLLADRHLPHLVPDVARQIENQHPTSKAEFLEVGRHLEHQEEWDNAVDVYLSAREGYVNSSDLEQIWNAAVVVARNHLSVAKQNAVLNQVAQLLCGIHRHESAAELYRVLGDLEKAINCSVEGKCWATARQLASGSLRHEVAVEEAHAAALRSAEDADGLMEHGDQDAVASVLLERKQWDRLWQLVEQKSIASVHRAVYAAEHIKHLLAKDDFRPILEVMKQRGMPHVSATATVYRRLISRLLGRSCDSEMRDFASWRALVQDFRDCLLGHTSPAMQDAGGHEETASDLHHLVMALHYFSVYLTCIAHQLKDIALKVAVTLLRYTGVIPVDKAFYQAGALAKELGHETLAFILLNHYIDVTEAMEETTPGTVDHSDFCGTCIPFPVDMPDEHYIQSEQDREDIRDWVLAICVDKSVSQQLPSRSQAVGTIYAGLYSSNSPTCIVTGYPVQPWEIVEISNVTANKGDWNHYVRVVKRCPWTNKEQVPSF